jgi:hypothetical protein
LLPPPRIASYGRHLPLGDATNPVIDQFFHHSLGEVGGSAAGAGQGVLAAAGERRHALAGVEQPVLVESRLEAMKGGDFGQAELLGHESTFSMPTPCSPVMVPPNLTDSSRISAPKAVARSSSPGWLASYMISGCRLPSPA